ncbi:MAG TPA: GNAT family N-acetyltransferase [Bacilli bacterium]|nr:GNAT family N-acetyltransferase [Bacilli bacterium]
MAIRTLRITNDEQVQQGLAIRREVFIEEQEVPEELEIDELEQVATHVLAYDETGTPVATGRIIPYENGTAGKMQRIAVLKSTRTGGYGRAVMAHLEQIGRELGYDKFVLEAQTHAEGFYHKLGYRTVSPEPFLEAGIWHVKMEKAARE